MHVIRRRRLIHEELSHDEVLEQRLLRLLLQAEAGRAEPTLLRLVARLFGGAEAVRTQQMLRFAYVVVAVVRLEAARLTVALPGSGHDLGMAVVTHADCRAILVLEGVTQVPVDEGDRLRANFAADVDQADTIALRLASVVAAFLTLSLSKAFGDQFAHGRLRALCRGTAGAVRYVDRFLIS